MTSQALARKWRPRDFAHLVGQEHVVRALSSALETRRLHHAYLLTGTRGVGKTTVARILAKCLNCETGLTATPCGVCGACTQIDSGRFVDLLELDAASNTGIDNMREVLEGAQYAPAVGRYKVYIIDEVHMLSKSAFNAMLKTLEEPPEHVKFVLATTDPQKVPITVLSRCLQFNLKQLPVSLIADHLARVLEAEQIGFEPLALQLLGQAAQGSMRDSLSLLDQAVAYGQGHVDATGVRGMLGTIDRDYLCHLLRHLAAGDGAAMWQQLGQMAERSVAFDLALQELASLLQQLALTQLVPDALDPKLPERATLLELAQQIDPETVQLYYQIVVHGRRDLPLAPDEEAGFGMVLLRMLAFAPQTADGPRPGGGRAEGRPAVPERSVAERVLPAATTLTSSLSAPVAPSPAVSAPPAAVSAPASPGRTPSAAEARNGAASLMERARARGRQEAQAGDAARPASDAARGAGPMPGSTSMPGSTVRPRAEVAPPPWEDMPPDAPLADSTTSASDLPEPPAWLDEQDQAQRDAETHHAVAATPLRSAMPLPPDAPGISPDPALDAWSSLAGRLPLAGMARQLVLNAQLEQWDGSHLHLRLPPEHRHLQGQQDKLRQVLEEVEGRPVQVQLTVADLTGDTPAMVRERAQKQRLADAAASLLRDPEVMQLRERAGARLVDGSIEPLS